MLHFQLKDKTFFSLVFLVEKRPNLLFVFYTSALIRKRGFKTRSEILSASLKEISSVHELRRLAPIFTGALMYLFSLNWMQEVGAHTIV